MTYTYCGHTWQQSLTKCASSFLEFPLIDRLQKIDKWTWALTSFVAIQCLSMTSLASHLVLLVLATGQGMGGRRGGGRGAKKGRLEINDVKVWRLSKTNRKERAQFSPTSNNGTVLSAAFNNWKRRKQLLNFLFSFASQNSSNVGQILTWKTLNFSVTSRCGDLKKK